MARKHTNATLGDIPYTVEEEAAQDALEALPPPPPPTKSERISAVFNGADVNTIMLKTLFAQHNRILALEGEPAITIFAFLKLFEGQLS